MYPTPVVFWPAEPGPNGVTLSWQVPEDLGIHTILVFRSRCPIPAEDTERFYRGELNAELVRRRLDGEARAMLDPVTVPAYYLVLGVGPGGDLHALEGRAEPRGAAVIVPEDARAAIDVVHRHDGPVELVFRDDDPMSRVQIRAVAASLGSAASRDLP